ncbi:MAG: ACT domain-containing protein [Anaerolineae bacterium]|nr:ACT domain-containing protein [Anaerolineae bacterium]
MTAESDLQALLHGMMPELHEGIYVFCTFADVLPVGLDPLMSFREAEGITAIVDQQQADRLGLAYVYPCVWITLTIHSDLSAVGFTAAISRALTENGISCNVVAAYYHDHLFVAAADGQRALHVLRQLAATGGS